MMVASLSIRMVAFYPTRWRRQPATFDQRRLPHRSNLNDSVMKHEVGGGQGPLSGVIGL